MINYYSDTYSEHITFQIHILTLSNNLFSNILSIHIYAPVFGDCCRGHVILPKKQTKNILFTSLLLSICVLNVLYFFLLSSLNNSAVALLILPSTFFLVLLSIYTRVDYLCLQCPSPLVDEMISFNIVLQLTVSIHDSN